MGITFSIILGKMGKNGRKVYIRVTYRRKSRDIPTSMYVKANEVTKGGRIKNVLVLTRCEELMAEYRQRAYNLHLERTAIEPAKVFELISNNAVSSGISFTAFACQWLEKSTRKGNDNYRTALRALHRWFNADEISAEAVNVRNLTQFGESLEGKPRARSMYLAAISKIFNDLREYYWDEVEGCSIVKHSLERLRVPKQGRAIKHNISINLGEIRGIFSLADVSRQKGVEQLGKNFDKSHLSGRAVLAVDCWVISFSLMGINSVDLYELTDAQYNGQYITYNRHKTRDRRADSARMVVAVPAFLVPLFAKYKGDGGRLFDFSERYATWKNFQIALNIGLKEVGELLGVGGLTFYSARHSFASVAVNVAGVDKYTCGEMLCHVDSAMRVTDTYIAKDWGRLHDAQAKVLAVVMEDEAGE